MAKTKAKSKTAASNVEVKVEAVSSNDNFVASESVDKEEAATTMVLDKSVEVVMNEDSKEVEEAEKIEGGLDGSEKENGPKEMETEESKDGLDPAEGADKIEETNDAIEKADEGDNKEKTKDVNVELKETHGPRSEEGEEREMTEEGKVIGKGEIVSNKKARRVRKRNKGVVGAAASNDANKSRESDKQKTEEIGVVEPMETQVLENEKVEEKDVTGEVKDKGPRENVPNKKGKRIRKRKKKTSIGTASPNDANKSSEIDKQGASAAAKDVKMADGMGLIFMCNAKTKKDCFQYKVLGLPEGKKDLVAKVYEGMRLFLFDIDLKLMHGIYKATSAGGYNIEPKAFKSAFPSQVRFSVLNDCLPLPEEKFKSAIKENYYARNKFNCQLSQEQVKNLCKLFESAVQTPKKRSGEVIRAEQEPGSSSKGRKRLRHEKIALKAERERTPPSRGQKRSNREREVFKSERDRNRPRPERARCNDSNSRAPPTRSFAPPPVPYAYVQPTDDYYYRREIPQVPVPMRTYELPPLEYRDPYGLYREPPPPMREAIYREAPLYREPVPYGVPVNPATYDPPLATRYRY